MYPLLGFYIISSCALVEISGKVIEISTPLSNGKIVD